MSTFTATLVTIGIAFAGAAAHADPDDEPRFPVRTLLTGGAGGGGGMVARAPAGWMLGVDAGWAELRPSEGDPGQDAPTYGVRVGYELPSGLAVEGRFDDLSVDSPTGTGPLLSVAGGLRYGVRLVPMPFVEALAGLAIYGPHTTPDVGIGVGASVLLGRHVMLDATLRDWIADLDGRLCNVPTLTAGVSIGY